MARGGLGTREGRPRDLPERIARSRLSARDRDRLNVSCAFERAAHPRSAIRSLRRSLEAVGLSYDAIGTRARTQVAVKSVSRSYTRS